jgi:acetyl esterase/lipase
MATTFPAPRLDPELAKLMTDPATTEGQEASQTFLNPDPTTLLAGRNLSIEDHTITVKGGEIMLSVIRPANWTPNSKAPCIYYMHGGGMVAGTRWTGLEAVLAVAPTNTVFVTVEYRLAPQNPDPAPVEDSYAGFLWTMENTAALGIDPLKVLTAGGSAGGGLCAGIALLSRDRGGPKACGQLLICPMLDDRNETISSHQTFSPPITREALLFCWNCYLGDRAGKEGVSIYAAPGRAEDLSGLPPAFLDVGSFEPFRDEVVKYAEKLWACGGDAELHVWPGGFHGFSTLAPSAQLSQFARRANTDWVHRILGSGRAEH